MSSVGMTVTLAALGGYFFIKDNDGDVSSITWLPLASLIFYTLFFSLGFGNFN